MLGSVFFCIKQKTAYEMRISDWSADVCSSDLLSQRHIEHLDRTAMRALDRLQGLQQGIDECTGEMIAIEGERPRRSVERDIAKGFDRSQIGRASCRERVCPYV